MDDNNLSYEAMDVDLSSHSTSAMDISYTDTSIIKSEILEAFEIESRSLLKPETVNKLIVCNPNSPNIFVSRSNVKQKIITFFSIILLILAYQIKNFKCCEDLHLQNLTEKLMTKLYGQPEAVKNIIRALETKEESKAFIFYGSTGVGKTFTASLILENYLDCNNIYHYTMPSFLQSFSSELMLGLFVCKSAIVVLDDLNKNDFANIIEPVNELLTKSKRLSKNITIILIFNIDTATINAVRGYDDLFLIKARQYLVDINAQKYFIKFERLTRAHLQQCIEDQLNQTKLTINDFDKILKTFNVTLDGCKGVHQKLQYWKFI